MSHPTIVRFDPSTIDYLCRAYDEKYNLYVNDFLKSVAGQSFSDDELKAWFEMFVAKSGWRAQVWDIVTTHKSDAIEIIQDRTPAYMHMYLPEFFETLEVVDEKDVVYTSDGLVGQFMLYLKSANVLEPLTTIPARSQPLPDILRERDPTWHLVVNQLQLNEIVTALKWWVNNPERTIHGDDWTDDVAEELHNMMEDDHLQPSPIINGLCM